jgi:GTP cyclohydrolase I
MLLTETNGNIPRTEEEKKEMIAKAAFHYGNFLTALGFKWEADENSKDTPHRVAKAWIHDLAKGSVSEKPKITHFPNGGYTGITFQGNIKVVSMCSHHNLAFTGYAHVAYIPKKKGKVIGLSKLNRIVDWYARRPQIQEGLTQQIADELGKLIDNEGIAVVITCNHTCCSNRGIGHDSTMQTAVLTGNFFDNIKGTRDEYYRMIANIK